MALDPRTDKSAMERIRMSATYVKQVYHAGKIWVVLNGTCIYLYGPNMNGDGKYQCIQHEKRPDVCHQWPKKNMNLWKKIHPECGYFE